MGDNIVSKFVESLTTEQRDTLLNLAALPGGMEAVGLCVQGKQFLNPIPEPQSFNSKENTNSTTNDSGSRFVLDRGITGRRRLNPGKDLGKK